MTVIQGSIMVMSWELFIITLTICTVWTKARVNNSLLDIKLLLFSMWTFASTIEVALSPSEGILPKLMPSKCLGIASLEF